MDQPFPKPEQRRPPMEVLALIPARKIVEAVRRAIERLGGEPMGLSHYFLSISPSTIEIRLSLDWSAPEAGDLFRVFSSLPPVRVHEAVKEVLEELAGERLDVTRTELRLADEELDLEMELDDPDWLPI